MLKALLDIYFTYLLQKPFIKLHYKYSDTFLVYCCYNNPLGNTLITLCLYMPAQVDITLGMDSGDLSDFVDNVEWECHGMPAVRNVMMYGCCSDPYTEITYTLLLKRRSSFYIFNLLLPCFLISFLAPLGFYLPADSGEKVSLGVTVLLALTVFQLLVAESMPPAENMPYIGLNYFLFPPVCGKLRKGQKITFFSLFLCLGKYYIATMTMITASTSLTIFIMNIHFCGAEAKPVPHWAKVLIIDYMSKIFFVYEVGENCTTPESEKTPLYPEEPMGDKLGYHDDRFHDSFYPHDSDPYKYSNGHSRHHHNKHHKNQANGSANGRPHRFNNHNNHASRMEKGEAKQEPTQCYHHIRRDELDYQAPPQLRNLQHLNGGLKEQILYPSEKLQIPACPCCCPCLQHKQVTLNLFLTSTLRASKYNTRKSLVNSDACGHLVNCSQCYNWNASQYSGQTSVWNVRDLFKSHNQFTRGK